MILWWVIIRNFVFVFFFNSKSILQNFSTLFSSNAASTSSKIHIGDGLIKKIENINEIAVSAFSPPDSKLIDDNFFPGGLA